MEVLVIGGGASGMMAAISAASMGAYVTVYEKEEVPGRKLLRTGNGRCNLGNKELRTDYFHSYDNELIDNYFAKFDEDDTIRTFRSLGLIIKDIGGYFYPFCEQAAVVRDVLKDNMLSYDIKLHTDTVVTKIEKIRADKFLVTTKDNSKEFDRVILACGSYAGLDKKDRIPGEYDGYSLAYSLGHTIIPVKPALTGLKTSDDIVKIASGVRCEALITLTNDGSYVGSEYGELQIADYGLSGIPVLQLSHYVGADPEGNYELKIDFMPGMNEDDYISLMQGRMLQYQGMCVSQFLLGTINMKLIELLLKYAELDPEDKICDETEDKVITLVGLIRCFTVKIKGTRDYTHAQVCSGGVPLREIDDNCASVKTTGLYICGEMLDVDGACGGYNLQWAWTSGYIAGRAAASR
ncbi:MAG: aminoacetone oxidase family FAD-binding enzyme [Lachnospiraceae bacterium]|nr:aminoacetone oxidase family FAD-binding enzyme [Lachnospiraceae bacterium]